MAYTAKNRNRAHAKWPSLIIAPLAGHVGLGCGISSEATKFAKFISGWKNCIFNIDTQTGPTHRNHWWFREAEIVHKKSKNNETYDIDKQIYA